MTDPKVVVALDFDNQADAFTFVDKIQPSDCRLKVGKEMFTYFGPDFVKALVERGFDVFLDLKFHDIPNTVAKAVAAAAELGVWMVNVHASGGSKMMEKAKEALLPYGDKAPLLIAVTVLTSMSEDDLMGLGITKSPAEQVQHLANLTKSAGLDGVVCSAYEAKNLRYELGDKFLLVTPGIRMPNSAIDDQRRICTPAEALHNGSDYLVIGRPITQASDPGHALDIMYSSITGN